jgi:hypothetical protein
MTNNFDVVVTSIGNAFYRTEAETGIFEWQPTAQEVHFLTQLLQKPPDLLKDAAFETLYAASAKQLAILPDNNLTCTRKQCSAPNSCGFIPNYPIIHFESSTSKPNAPWVELAEVAGLFRTLASS